MKTVFTLNRRQSLRANNTHRLLESLRAMLMYIILFLVLVYRHIKLLYCLFDRSLHFHGDHLMDINVASLDVLQCNPYIVNASVFYNIRRHWLNLSQCFLQVKDKTEYRRSV